MKDKCCANCVFCDEISPLKYYEKRIVKDFPSVRFEDEEYQGYCKKKDIYLLTTEDRLCDDAYIERG